MAGGEVGDRPAQCLERGLRVLGAARVHGDRAALLLDPGALPGAHRVEQTRQLGPHGGDARDARAGVHGAADGVPALGAVVAEYDEVFEPCDPGEAAVPHGDARGPAGDHGDGRDERCELGERGHGCGVCPGLLRVRHDLGECAVEVECDHASPGRARIAVRPSRPAAVAGSGSASE